MRALLRVAPVAFLTVFLSRFAAPARAAEAQASVVCKDGSSSKGGKGACSGHGGVNKSAGKAGAKTGAAATAGTGAATPPPASSAATTSGGAAQSSAGTSAKNTSPTGATAMCKDGTYSHAKNHSGACSSHGGVAQWLDK